MTTRRVLTGTMVAFVVCVACNQSPPPSPPPATSLPRSAASTDGGPIRADVFKIVHERSGNLLTVSLNTDLPDAAVLIVSVSRSYFEKGSNDEL